MHDSLASTGLATFVLLLAGCASSAAPANGGTTSTFTPGSAGSTQPAGETRTATASDAGSAATTPPTSLPDCERCQVNTAQQCERTVTYVPVAARGSVRVPTEPCEPRCCTPAFAGGAPPGPAGGPDRDADGIPDSADRCPDAPEDRDGFQDGDGCPDPDNDGDGIDDAHDRCRNQAEDRDGVQDDDGCPE